MFFTVDPALLPLFYLLPRFHSQRAQVMPSLWEGIYHGMPVPTETEMAVCQIPLVPKALCKSLGRGLDRGSGQTEGLAPLFHSSILAIHHSPNEKGKVPLVLDMKTSASVREYSVFDPEISNVFQKWENYLSLLLQILHF